MRKVSARRVLYAGGFGLLCALAAYAGWPRIARALVFLPEARSAGAMDPARTYPAARVQRAAIPSENGLWLHAWWFSAQGRPCGTVVYYYGNQGNLLSRTRAAEALAARRLNVLVLDYRGYGASPGTPTEPGLYRDAHRAYRWVRDVRGVPADQILLMGHSIGAALAAGVGAREPSAGLVLLSPFSSFPGATAARLPWAPERIRDWGGHRFATLDDVPRVAAPLLAARGTRDPFTDRADALRVFAAAGSGTKTWLDVRGAGHNDLFSSPALWDALTRFRDQTLPCGRRTPPDPAR